LLPGCQCATLRRPRRASNGTPLFDNNVEIVVSRELRLDSISNLLFYFLDNVVIGWCSSAVDDSAGITAH
jgi:hypothetical protein